MAGLAVSQQLQVSLRITLAVSAGKSYIQGHCRTTRRNCSKITSVYQFLSSPQVGGSVGGGDGGGDGGGGEGGGEGG